MLMQRILYIPRTALNDFESRYGSSGSGWATTLELSHRNHWLHYPIVLSYLGWTMGQWRNRNEKVLQRKLPVPQQHVMRAFQHYMGPAILPNCHQVYTTIPKARSDLLATRTLPPPSSCASDGLDSLGDWAITCFTALALDLNILL